MTDAGELDARIVAVYGRVRTARVELARALLARAALAVDLVAAGVRVAHVAGRVEPVLRAARWGAGDLECAGVSTGTVKADLAGARRRSSVAG